MEILSNAKIENILSLTGNNKCFECGSSDVDWVSFPSTVFLCLNCCRRHKEFKLKLILKSLSVSEFTQHEIKKMNLGGNARFLTLMNDYKISLKEPNIEHKYQTVIAFYYYKLLELQVNKIENNKGADEEYNKILGERPTYEKGCQLSQELEINENNRENNGENGYKTDSTLGGWLGYFGDKINNVSEFIGFNALVQNANNSLEHLGVKDAISKAVDYSKSAGEYVVDKAKEVANAPIVNDATQKIISAYDGVKDTTINMIKNVSGNNENLSVINEPQNQNQNEQPK